MITPKREQEHVSDGLLTGTSEVGRRLIPTRNVMTKPLKLPAWFDHGMGS